MESSLNRDRQFPILVQMVKIDPLSTWRTVNYLQNLKKQQHEVGTLYVLVGELEDHVRQYTMGTGELYQYLKTYKNSFNYSIFKSRISRLFLSETIFDKYSLRAKIVFKSYCLGKMIPYQIF